MKRSEWWIRWSATAWRFGGKREVAVFDGEQFDVTPIPRWFGPLQKFVRYIGTLCA